MKKALVLALSVVMILCAFGVQAFAEGESANVYVTVANGTLVLTQESITVTDIDGDGALTVNDALYCAHEAKYEGGAAAGYGFAEGDYGLALTKLWGVENGSGYGYYVNNASAMGLTDIVLDGDYINAFVYTDTTYFSDSYCFFDVNTKAAVSGTEFTLTLSAAGYDENWAPVVVPVEGAVITVDGVATEYKTDSQGKVTIRLDGAKECVISATSATQILVAPVCVVAVGESAPQPGDSGVYIYIALSIVALAAIVLIATRRKHAYEK